MKDISVRGNQHIIIVTAVRNFHLVTDKFSFSNFFPGSRGVWENVTECSRFKTGVRERPPVIEGRLLRIWTRSITLS